MDKITLTKDLKLPKSETILERGDVIEILQEEFPASEFTEQLSMIIRDTVMFEDDIASMPGPLTNFIEDFFNLLIYHTNDVLRSKALSTMIDYAKRSANL